MIDTPGCEYGLKWLLQGTECGASYWYTDINYSLCICC